MKEVLIISKTVYGKDLLYPGNEAAEIFLSIKGAKTFSPADLAKVRDLGFSTRVVGYVAPAPAFNPDVYPAGANVTPWGVYNPDL